MGTSSRFEKADFSSSWYSGAVGGIIPYPRPQLNFKAAFQPLAYQVYTMTRFDSSSVFILFHFIANKRNYVTGLDLDRCFDSLCHNISPPTRFR